MGTKQVPLETVRKTYERLGRRDPFWAVLTDDSKRGNKWDPEAFFATGRDEIDGILKQIDELGLSFERGRALDFGCGLGRLSQALCRRFEHVVGVDISHTMVEKARELSQHPQRCEYITNTEPDLACLESESFDFIYSNITLQHMAPRYSSRYIAEFFRVLRPKGLAVFQVPGGPDYTKSALRQRIYTLMREHIKPFWKRVRGRPPVQIHYVPKKKVEQIIADANGALLGCREDRLGWSKRRAQVWYFATRTAGEG